MSNIKIIKDAIKTQLDALVTSNVLGAAEEIDLRKDPLSNDFAGFPHAFLMPPSMESAPVDNRTLLRRYTFAIMIVEKAENITSNTQIEELMEAIVNKFDNVPTLNGAADGAVEPAFSSPEPLQHSNRNLVVFFVTLKVDRTESLTYTL